MLQISENELQTLITFNYVFTSQELCFVFYMWSKTRKQGEEKSSVPLVQKDVAKEIGMSLSRLSQVITSLEKKLVVVVKQEGEERHFSLNPHTQWNLIAESKKSQEPWKVWVKYCEVTGVAEQNRLLKGKILHQGAELLNSGYTFGEISLGIKLCHKRFGDGFRGLGYVANIIDKMIRIRSS